MGLAADALWLKRDDLSGLGGGGNKVRKLQYTCAQALAAGATTVITTGAPQSNHARLTAAAAARLGLRSVLVLKGEQPDIHRGNLVLDQLAGAQLVWTRDATPQQVHREVERQAQKVRDDGGIPHVIPFGGSNSYAARGYVDCAVELLAQLPDLDHVVVAFGSGATMAGLVAHLGAERVIGIDTGAVADPRTTLSELLDGMPGVAQSHSTSWCCTAGTSPARPASRSRATPPARRPFSRSPARRRNRSRRPAAKDCSARWSMSPMTRRRSTERSASPAATPRGRRHRRDQQGDLDTRPRR